MSDFVSLVELYENRGFLEKKPLKWQKQTKEMRELVSFIIAILF
jgi:hypothetical protein